jgi:hypothetical protein
MPVNSIADWTKYKYTSLFDYDKVTNSVGSRVDAEVAGLDPKVIDNLNSLMEKFPNSSKDYLLSAAKIGLNANSQGIDKLSAHDNLASLKQDLFNIDNINAQAKKDKSFTQSIYSLLKGTSRVGFAALQAPYQYVSSVGRDIYALSKGEINLGEAIQNNSFSMLGDTTNLGQLLQATGGLIAGKGPVDAGSGFFITPETKVGAAQAKAMSAYGRINGKSFTIGRAALSGVGADPNGTPYRVMSGVVDAVLNVGLDPSTWFGPGSVTKVIKGGKELQGAKKAAQAVEEAKQAGKVATIDELNKIDAKKIEQFTAGKDKIKRTLNNTFLANESKIQKQIQSTTNALVSRVEKALTFGTKRGSEYTGNAEVAKLIEKGSIGDFVIKNAAERTPQGVIEDLAQLEADYINTGKTFTGIYFDDVPQAGQLKLGSFDNGEYVATIGKDTKLDLIDLGKTYANSTADERLLELNRRADFYDKLLTFADEPTTPEVTSIAIKEFVNGTPSNARNSIKASYDDLIFGPGSESLGMVIGRAVGTKNEHLIQKVNDLVSEIWAADGYTNIRSIHGAVGGVVITNGAKLGARQVGISNVLTTFTGKASLGAELGTKLIDSVKDTQQELIQLNNSLKAAQEARLGIDNTIKDIEGLRDFAAMDPDVVAKLLNDPNNVGISKYLNLQMDIAKNQYAKEFYMSEIGLTEAFGGSLKGDLTRAATYMLGKRFELVADIVAKETDFSRIHRLFGRKLDVEMTKELVNAKTGDEVISVFLKHLAAPTSDPKVYRSLALKGETALLSNNPLIKTVAPIAIPAVKWAEKAEKNFGRYFKRQMVLPLDDTDRLINGLEDWMSSAGISDDIIDDTLNRISQTTSSKQRASVVFDEMAKTQRMLAEQLVPGDKAVADAVEDAFRVTGRENAVIKQYIAERLAYGEVPSLNLMNGEVFEFAKNQAIFDYQFLDDVVKLPDIKDIKELIGKYQKNKTRFGVEKAVSSFNTELGDRWRTAQLAFRASYIMRNIGEMQFRQYFSGHESLFNHPFSYIAMLAGNANGNKVQKFLAPFARYTNDVNGNKLIGKDGEAEAAVSAFVEENFNFLARNQNSNDPRFAFVGKIYEPIGPEDSRYHLGLANTLIRAHTDRLIPKVAQYGDTVDPDTFVKLLVDESPGFEGILDDLINGGGRNGVEKAEFAKLFLKEPKLNKTTKRFDITPENLNLDNIKTYIFDKNSTGSVARYVDNIAGTGPHANVIRELLGKGEVTVNGKLIKIPGYKKAGNINDFADEDSTFKSLLARNFKAEDMTGSTVISTREKKFGKSEFKQLDIAINMFFDVATKIENVVNFAPEFRMSYWDHVGRYVGMVNDDVLKTLEQNAIASLKPLTLNGKNISLRRHPSLTAIRKEINARAKGKSVTDGIDLDTMNSMAAKQASNYTKNLFYDAAQQRQYANAVRIIFPFAQAQFNTLYKWGKLSTENPLQFYKVGRAYNALTQQGSSAIYDLTGVKYDENQGFFYKDEFGESRFRYPLAGSVIGALAAKNIDAGQALQLTAPVQSLNLGLGGSINPGMPGIGPVGQFAFTATGKSQAFGPVWDALRGVVIPFGETTDPVGSLAPAWLRKSFYSLINNDAMVERGVKDWASYLASTGDYGDNPLADDTARNELFNDARNLSRWSTFMGGFFQSIAPATPSQEVFAKDKQGKLMTQTAIYNAWDQISQKHPGDYFGSVGEFSDTFGIKNILVILAGSTRAVRGTADAWSFLNNNPEAAAKYATATGDIVPYFFPGGEAATAYYNWQKATSRRELLPPAKLQQYAESLVYQMAKSQISEEQAQFGYGDVWYSEQIIELNKKFSGNAPVLTADIGSAQDKISNVAKALQDPAFEQSPVYKETKLFYDRYKEYEKYLQEVRSTATPKFGGGSWYAKELARQLDGYATELMIANPAFARMYYGVFASIMKVEE